MKPVNDQPLVPQTVLAHVGLVSRMGGVLALARPKQQVKNALVLAALVFSGSLQSVSAISRSVVALIVFCSASAGVYAFNDFVDRAADRKHPTKSHRPVASGLVPPALAVVMASVYTLVALLVSTYLPWQFQATLFTYLLLQLAYSRYLKRQELLDMFAVAFGYVLRAVGGAAALDVRISPWLVLCTLLLALFLVTGKRHAELTLAQASEHRAVLLRYSSSYLQHLMVMTGTSAVLTYCLYALTSDTAERHPLLVLTVPPVLYGLFRYLQVVVQDTKGGQPEEVLFRDAHIRGAVLLWVVLVLVALYL